MSDTTNPERELADTVASQHKSVNKTAPVSPGTDYKELEQRARLTYTISAGVLSILTELADAIRQQAERISTLQAKIYLVDMDRDNIKSKLSAAQRRLEKWEGQQSAQIIRIYSGQKCRTGDGQFRAEVISAERFSLGQTLIARLPDDEGEKV